MNVCYATQLEGNSSEDWSETLAGLIAHVRNVTRGSVNLFLAMAHQPTLTERFIPFGAAFITDGVLDPRLREIAVLRTAVWCRSPYVWAHHVRIAQSCGVTDKEIKNIDQKDLSGWGADENAIVSSVDELAAEHRLKPVLWRDLVKRFGSGGAVELVMLIGQYTQLAGLANSAEVLVEPGMAAPYPLPAPPGA